MGRLMCDLGLNYEKMSGQLGIDFTAYFSQELASLSDLKADGLIETDARGLVVTDLGRLLIRNIAVRFNAYFGKGTGERFSKSI